VLNTAARLAKKCPTCTVGSSSRPKSLLLLHAALSQFNPIKPCRHAHTRRHQPASGSSLHPQGRPSRPVRAQRPPFNSDDLNQMPPPYRSLHQCRRTDECKPCSTRSVVWPLRKILGTWSNKDWDWENMQHAGRIQKHAPTVHRDARRGEESLDAEGRAARLDCAERGFFEHWQTNKQTPGLRVMTQLLESPIFIIQERPVPQELSSPCENRGTNAHTVALCAKCGHFNKITNHRCRHPTSFLPDHVTSVSTKRFGAQSGRLRSPVVTDQSPPPLKTDFYAISGLHGGEDGI
jgi:hypothetical protein